MVASLLMKLSGQKIMSCVRLKHCLKIICGKFLAYFRARVLLANMSKKGNDFTVIPRIAKQRNMYRTYTYGILLYYGDASF